jgi:hypothetical protein
MHLMLHVRTPGVPFFHRVRPVLHPPCHRERDDERQGATTLFAILTILGEMAAACFRSPRGHREVSPFEGLEESRDAGTQASHSPDG